MCSQCSQRVKNDVKLVLSMLRFGYTFGYTLTFYSHFIIDEKAHAWLASVYIP